jgi:hypothetical protein
LVNRLRVDGRTDFSETELTALTPAEIHRLCRGLGVETVIVTLGHRGCLVSQPGAVAMVPAHRVEVVDTTGAGDAFVGGFAAGWVRSRGGAWQCRGGAVRHEAWHRALDALGPRGRRVPQDDRVGATQRRREADPRFPEEWRCAPAWRREVNARRE